MGQARHGFGGAACADHGHCLVHRCGPAARHLIFIYFLPTALIAIRYGSISAMCVAIVSTVAAAYFFYLPQFSFRVESPLEALELVFFSLLALLAIQVVSGFDNDSSVEKRHRRTRAMP